MIAPGCLHARITVALSERNTNHTHARARTPIMHGPQSLIKYVAAFPVAKLERVAHILKKLSAETAFFDLEGSTFSHNTEEGSAEIK